MNADPVAIEVLHMHKSKEERAMEQPSILFTKPDTGARRWIDVLKSTILVAVLAVASASGLVACGGTRHVLTTPGNPVAVAERFPNALLAEPIQLRNGYVHWTQPFSIKDAKERWDVALGFVRSDRALTQQQKLDGGSDLCWVESPAERAHLVEDKCRNANPGFYLEWELIREDGAVVARYIHDNLIQRGGGTYAGDAITRTLSGFTNMGKGTYRIRVTVLRDARELEFLKPHIVVNLPFFRRN